MNASHSESRKKYRLTLDDKVSEQVFLRTTDFVRVLHKVQLFVRTYTEVQRWVSS